MAMALVVVAMVVVALVVPLVPPVPVDQVERAVGVATKVEWVQVNGENGALLPKLLHGQSRLPPPTSQPRIAHHPLP